MIWINRRRLPPDSSLGLTFINFRAGHDIYRGVTQFAPARDLLSARKRAGNRMRPQENQNEQIKASA
jgi:hypothetical protein